MVEMITKYRVGAEEFEHGSRGAAVREGGANCIGLPPRSSMRGGSGPSNGINGNRPWALVGRRCQKTCAGRSTT